METNIGKLLERFTSEKRLTLKELAQKSGLSISFFPKSRILKSSSPLQSLSKIADALEVSRSYFFPEATPPKKALFGKTQKVSTFNQSNFVYQSLSNEIPNPLFEPMLVVFFRTTRK